MFEFIKTIYLSLGAPLWAVLGCPIALVLALHFASDKNVQMQGARVDAVAREARLTHNTGRSWLKSLGFFVTFGFSLFCFIYIFDRDLLIGFMRQLPF
jgi:hypothetical protein